MVVGCWVIFGCVGSLREKEWQFVFACRVCVVSTHGYSTIWVNPNLTCLLDELEFLNSNTTFLLNESVVSTCLSNFIQKKKIFSINQIDMNYEKKTS